MTLSTLPSLLAALALPLLGGPLLLGIVQRTKAVVAGRRGPPLLQPLLDIVKLLRKGAVLSDVSTGMLVLGPAAFLATAAWAGVLVPLGAAPAPLAFAGDVFLFAGVLATGRFLLAAAAMDVGSSFEAMGASRDLGFSALAEPVLLLALAVTASAAGGTSLSSLGAVAAAPVPTTVLAVLALYVVLLAENARVPFDDPATHLELTMVHEVMVLDHGGPDLAFVHWGSAAKLFVFAQILTAPLAARVPSDAVALAVHLGLVLATGVLVGLTESVTARLRLVRVPHLLLGGLMLAAFAAAIAFLRRGS
jgi:formate hydrogenlyase subunit 4